MQFHSIFEYLINIFEYLINNNRYLVNVLNFRILRILMSLIEKLRLADLKQKILSASTQRQSVERDVIRFDAVLKDPMVSCEPLWLVQRQGHPKKTECILHFNQGRKYVVGQYLVRIEPISP